MTTAPLPSVAQADQLTDALRHAGVLGQGRVSDVVVERSTNTVLSRIVRLRLSYDGAATKAPHSVILKTELPDAAEWQVNAGRHEVAFYAEVAAAMAPGVVPRCFVANSDADTKAWHLLLEDLTDSHFVATAWPLPPTFEQCKSIMQARARFQAAWWDDARLGSVIGSWLDAEALNRNIQHSAEQFARFTDRFGDHLSSERRLLYERLFDAAPRLLARYLSRRNITVVQGDAHVWNNFLPRDGADDVRIFDWDAWHIDAGSDDLAYMIAMHWYPDRRRLLERQLLDYFHEELVAQGVSGYDRRALHDDYRLSALWQILRPIWQAVNDIPPVIWWNNLERSLLAVDDLGCRDLLS